MIKEKHSHLIPVLQALLVTILWSSSFVIIKIGLSEIPPVLFAGLRYIIAFIFLLPVLLRKKYIQEIKSLKNRDWLNLFFLGIIFYTLTQGAQFLGLSLLPSVTVSLWLNFTPLVVAIMGIFLLQEIPAVHQWFGAALFLTGVFTYFFPVNFSDNQLLGLLVMTAGVSANAGAAILGRGINRNKKISPIVVTCISMGIGSIFLLIPGLTMHGFPSISLLNFVLLLWMAGVNTAFAFTLWNVTLRSLTAVESSIINGTMLIQIGILAYIFLGEEISTMEGTGMLIAAAGIIIVQLKRKKKIPKMR